MGRNLEQERPFDIHSAVDQVAKLAWYSYGSIKLKELLTRPASPEPNCKVLPTYVHDSAEGLLKLSKLVVTSPTEEMIYADKGLGLENSEDPNIFSLVNIFLNYDTNRLILTYRYSDLSIRGRTFPINPEGVNDFQYEINYYPVTRSAILDLG